MSKARAAEAHAILTECLDLPPGVRREHGRQRCGDDEALWALVSGMIESAERVSSFLESPHIPERLAPPRPDAVGSYLILGVLGVGGMATVYEAEQEKPKRRVALKVMRQSIFDREAHLRFAFETEVLARLVHPNIAQIYEAGVSEVGQSGPVPFFAMELVVQALPITLYATENKMDLRQRLEMFGAVCDAVEHGHRVGVVHRDVKPGNVLVGVDGIPKVIDFGIASVTGADSDWTGGECFSSAPGGTLNYMSPEQFADSADIDTRTDVYSLGVLLYELITGQRPFDVSGLSIPEAARAARETRLPFPIRGVPDARPDLDAIVHKAMAHDRSGRYDNAGAMGEDVRRYLENLPVLAHPPSRMYFFRKFVRRNRSVSAAVGIALVSLVIGLAVSVRSASIAKSALHDVTVRERELESVVSYQESRLSDIDVREMGERLRVMLLEAGRAPDGDGASSLEGALEGVNFTSLALSLVDEEILQRSSRSISEQFEDQPLLRARLLHRLAGTMYALGLQRKALPVLRESLRLREEVHGLEHEETLESMHALGSLYSVMGDFGAAIETLESAHEASRRALGADHRMTLRIATSLGGAYRNSGDASRAERVWNDTLERQRRTLGSDDPETLRTLNNVGIMYALTGELDRAEAAWRELIERQKRVLGPEQSTYRSSLSNLGVLLTDMGRYEQALPLVRESMEAARQHLGDRHPDTLHAIGAMAMLLRDMGMYDRAESLQREVVAGRLEVLGQDHASTLIAQVSLASIMLERGALDDAENLLLRTAEKQRVLLGDAHPDVLDTLELLVKILLRAERVADAKELSDRVLMATDADPREPGWVRASRLVTHARILLAEDAAADALVIALAAHETLALELGTTHPHTRDAANSIADIYTALHAQDPLAGYGTTAARWRERGRVVRAPETGSAGR